MLDDNRQFVRFKIPLIVKYRSAKKKEEYSYGVTNNFSCEGFSFNSLKFNFEPEETLELKLELPKQDRFVSFVGDVVWKGQDWNMSLAGIKMREINEGTRSEILKEISDHGKIPVGWFFYDRTSKGITENKSEEKVIDKSNAETDKVENASEEAGNSVIEKKSSEYVSARSIVFRLPVEAAPDADKVTIVGDFNDWDEESKKMDRLGNGDFACILELKSGKEYRFKYLIDGRRWENDWFADKYVPNTYGSYDSVVVVES